MADEIMKRPSFLPTTDDQEETQGLVSNPLELFPRLIMNKGRKGFYLGVGDEEVDSFRESVYFLVAGAKNFYGSRALFPPYDENSDSNQPVCASRLLHPRAEWAGEWMSEDYESPSGEKYVMCSKCPWSEFGSEPEWDESKSGRGPACKERRVIFGFICEKAVGFSEENPYFSLKNKQPVRLVVPATSIKNVEQIPIQATTSNLPLQAAVFQLSSQTKERGSITWSVITARLAGLIGTEQEYHFIEGKVSEIARLVSNTVPDTSSYNSTSHTDEEIDDVFDK